MKLTVTVDGVPYEVEVEVEEERRPPIGPYFAGGGFHPQHAVAPAATAKPSEPSGPSGPAESAESAEGQAVAAPLAGTVVRVPVSEGQEVSAGDVLVVLEAMKMETEITAPVGAVVSSIEVAAHDTVASGQTLLWLDRS